MARILIIDDDEQILTSLREVLEWDRHEVVDAPNGEVGVKLFREEPADLVITDILMPEKEGTETIRELPAKFPGSKNHGHLRRGAWGSAGISFSGQSPRSTSHFDQAFRTR